MVSKLCLDGLGTRLGTMLAREHNYMKRLRILIPLSVTALIALFAFAPASYAACASQAGYAAPGGNSQMDVSGASNGSNCNKGVAGVENGNGPTSNVSSSAPQQAAATPSASSGSSLPFTGLDLTMVLVAGLVLTGLGVTLRRIATHRPTHQ